MRLFFSQIYVHIVFSTKSQEAFLTDRAVRKDIHGILLSLCDRFHCPALRIGGAADHVHLLVRLATNMSASGLVKTLKEGSLQWIKARRPELAAFYWQSGYGAFSIDANDVDALCDSIENQEEQHKTESYQDEFRRLLRTNGLEWDEQSVWD